MTQTNSPPLPIALAGISEVAIQQHLPAITASPDWQLVATCSRSGLLGERITMEPFYD
ncbi:MAG: hypothetical protein ACPGVP_21395 [Thiolinea sp.]